MTSEFTRLTIDEAVELIIDHRGRTPRKLGGDFTDHGVQVISAKNVYGHRLHADESQRFVPPEMARSWMPNGLRPGDVLLTSEAPLGQAAYVNGDERFCLGQRLFALRARPGKVHGRFLYYALISPAIQARLHARASGTTAQGIKQAELRQVELDLPTSSEQERIAAVLGALDDKIDSNERLARGLARLAHVEFRRMFGGRLEGPGRLGDHVMVTRGRSYKSSELTDSERALVTLKSVQPGGGYNPAGLKPYTGDFKPEQVVRPGELVVAHTDLTQKAVVVGKPAIIPDRGGYSELVASLDLGIVRPASDKVDAPFLYHLFLEPAFQHHAYGFANGSTVLHLNKDAIPSFPIELPEPGRLRTYSELATPLLERARGLHTEKRTLAQLRDALLPKVVSGEIRVADSADPAETTEQLIEEHAA